MNTERILHAMLETLEFGPEHRMTISHPSDRHAAISAIDHLLDNDVPLDTDEIALVARERGWPENQAVELRTTARTLISVRKGHRRLWSSEKVESWLDAGR